LQRDFAVAILARCKEAGVHTGIETAGNCRWDDLAQLLPVTDLIMMDLKHMDTAKHRAVAGVGNERILANARRLMETDKPVIFRTPIVPSVNDTPEDISAIGAFVQELAALRQAHNQHSDGQAPLPVLEMLPFHRLAGDKYRSLGLEDRASRLETPAAEQMMELAQAARQYDIEVRIQ
jgi:pyruvate formate lyase activating enzyme